MIKNTYMIYMLQSQHLKSTLPTFSKIYDLGRYQLTILGVGSDLLFLFPARVG